LERLLKLLEKKTKDPSLIKALTEKQESIQTIMSLQELKSNLGDTAYTKLIKGVMD
jgi:hypothetical protein